MTGRRWLALLLLLATGAPVAALAAQGVCADECATACGDCGLCLGSAVAPDGVPSFAALRGSIESTCGRLALCSAPNGVPEPVPLFPA